LSEEFPVPDEILAVIRMVAFGIFIVAMVLFMTNVYTTTGLDFTQKASREIGNTLLSGPATEQRGIFLAEKLDEYMASPLQEPIGRHCSMAYHMKIESLDPKIKNADGGNAWEFGFEPSDVSKEYSNDAEKEFAVAVRRGEYTGPAKLTIKVYRTWLTDVSCMLAEAYATGQAQTLATSIACVETQETAVPGLAGSRIRGEYCNLYLKKESGQLCYIKAEDGREETRGCRTIDDALPFDSFRLPDDFYYSLDAHIVTYASPQFALKAVPLRKGETLEADNAECGDYESKVAETREEIGQIYLCIDKGL